MTTILNTYGIIGNFPYFFNYDILLYLLVAVSKFIILYSPCYLLFDSFNIAFLDLRFYGLGKWNKENKFLMPTIYSVNGNAHSPE